MATLAARPEPLEVDFTKSAVIVVDMQNAFASKRGMLDLAGRNISDAPRVIEYVKVVVDAARLSGVPLVFLQMGYQPDLSDGGGPDSPNWHKELGIRMMECTPELKGKLVTVGSWDFEIVDELRPHLDAVRRRGRRPERLVLVRVEHHERLAVHDHGDARARLPRAGRDRADPPRPRAAPAGAFP